MEDLLGQGMRSITLQGSKNINFCLSMILYTNFVFSTQSKWSCDDISCSSSFLVHYINLQRKCRHIKSLKLGAHQLMRIAVSVLVLLIATSRPLISSHFVHQVILGVFGWYGGILFYHSFSSFPISHASAKL